MRWFIRGEGRRGDGGHEGNAREESLLGRRHFLRQSPWPEWNGELKSQPGPSLAILRGLRLLPPEVDFSQRARARPVSFLPICTSSQNVL